MTNRYHILLSFLLLLLLSFSLHAHEVPADTLLTRFYQRAADLMGEGAYEEAQRSFDSAFATPGVKQSPLYPILLNEQATLLVYIGKGEQAFAMKKSVLPYLPRVNDLEKHISVYNDLAILYRQRHINDSVLYYYEKALDAALAYKDESWIAHIYNNVAVYYFNIRHLAEAGKYIDLAAEYAQLTDDKQVIFTTWQLRSSIKGELNQPEEAGYSIREAWQIASQAGGNAPIWQIRCMPGLLKLFERTGQPDSMEYYLQLGNRLLKEVPDNSIPALGFIQARAAAEMNRKHYAQALTDYHRLRQRNIGTEPKTLFVQMAQCYQALGQLQQAYAYMDSARMWTDTLAQRNLTQQMAELNAKYQTREKELQIARLQQKQLEHKTFRLKVFIVAGCLSLVLLLSLLALRHKKHLAEKQVELLKQENELNAARRYIEGREEECKHFAKELHDGIANDLLGLQMKIETSVEDENRQSLVDLVGGLRNYVRRISHELMPPEFEHLTLNRILADYVSHLNEYQGKESVHFTSGADTSSSLPPDIAYEVYRIVQETTMNILRHSSADHIEIRLEAHDSCTYELRITDNGQPQAQSGPTEKGIGLRTIADRIKTIGGTAQTEYEDGKRIFILSFKTDTDESYKL